MDSNCKNKYNLDHVYCHPNEGGYIRANQGATDILALLKENKQLKAMLLLHLDLIQEQSDQLMAKDKLLSSLKEENEALKSRVEKVERRIQMKYTKSPEPSLNSHESGLRSEPAALVTEAEPAIPEGDKPPSPVTSSSNEESKYKICDDTHLGSESIIGESNGKFISKIILQRVHKQDQVSLKDELMLHQTPIQQDTGISVKDLAVKGDSQMHNDTEDSFSCGSADQDQSQMGTERSRKRKKYGTLTTSDLYATREWEDQKIDEETNKEEAEALCAEEPNLEIPKWTIKEFTGLYSIEGTENLSDDVFLKRHAKLELDEKRRKKWDVQRIREQRTIERLKRRHCKVEVPDSQNEQEIKSFFPSADSIKFIQITDELPVQAFGDGIPRLNAREFTSSVLQLTRTTSSEATELTSYSNIVFLKKRRRQHSQSVSNISRRLCKRPAKH